MGLVVARDVPPGRLGDPHMRVEDGLRDADHGRVDNVMQIHSLNPAAMAGHLAVYGSAMAGTKTLRKVERELVALVVSRYNDCHY